MTEEKTFKERFEALKEKFNNFKNEETDLEKAGIKELNTKIGILVELDNNARNLAKEIKSNTNEEDLVSDGEVLGYISELLKSVEEESDSLRDAQRGREKLRNKIIDEKHLLETNRNEFDFKVNEATEKINGEKQVLDMDLSSVDRNYHESLLNVYEKYIDALNEERVPVDELYNKYNGEIELLLDGGKPNYKLEEGNLVENASIPEIKEEDVITEDTVMEEEPEHVEELVAEPFTEDNEDKYPLEEEPKLEEYKEPDTVEENIDQIRSEVASELAHADEEVKGEEITEKEDTVFNPFGEYLTDAEEPIVDKTEETPYEPVVHETPAVETEKEEVDDNPLFDDSFTYEPVSEESNPIDSEIVEKTPVVSETIEETSQEPDMKQTTEELSEEKNEDNFDMLTALKNFREELGSIDDDKLEVVGAKESSIDLLKKVTPEVLESATQYMNKYNKELNVQKEASPVEPQYELREGETLSANITDENGEEKTVEIDTEGNKTIMDKEGNVLNTEHVKLDENTLNGENVKVVDTSDISLRAEEPQDLVPHMPDFSSLEEPDNEGFARKMVA